MSNRLVKVGISLCMVLVVGLFLSACGGGKYKDGVYAGEGLGHNGPIKVTVTVQGGKIKEVAVTQHSDSPGVSDQAIQKVPKDIVEKQTWEVDSVSGATNTSKGIKEAVKNALSSVKK